MQLSHSDELQPMLMELEIQRGRTPIEAGVNPKSPSLFQGSGQATRILTSGRTDCCADC